MTMIMTNRVEAIQAWMQQIQTAIEEKNRDELDPIELHILHWICFNGFEDMHDVQIGVIFEHYEFELPSDLIVRLCHLHEQFSTWDCPLSHKEIVSLLEKDKRVLRDFRTDFFNAFEKDFEKFGLLDYYIRFDVEMKNVKGYSCYGTLQFKLSDLNVGLHDVGDYDGDDWAELIRNETNFDVEIYQELGVFPG